MSEASPQYAGPDRSDVGRRPRRQDVLIGHLRKAIEETGLSESGFAQALVRHYRTLVPDAVRNHDMPDLDDDGQSADEYLHALDRVRKRVNRYCDGGLHLPVELEEAWVAALPAPYGGRCARDMARRYGFLGASAPDASPGVAEDLASVGRVGEVHGRAQQVVSKMLANGRFGPEDSDIAPEALRLLHDEAANVMSLIALIEERVASKPNVAELRRA